MRNEKIDPFWSKNIKLSNEEIKQKFPKRIAETLLIQKEKEEKI